MRPVDIVTKSLCPFFNEIASIPITSNLLIFSQSCLYLTILPREILESQILYLHPMNLIQCRGIELDNLPTGRDGRWRQTY